MSANTTIRVSELDFDTIRNNLKTFLRSQTEFQDFDFEGSGMSVLLDLLAYNTHYMGYYLNMVGNEMFLDTAQLRASVVSHAKSLNYTSRSRTGARTKINLTVVPTDSVDLSTIPSLITLDKYTPFLGADISGLNYQFLTVNSNTATKSASNTYTFSNVVIRQGEVVTRQYVMNSASNEKRRFKIPSANVDIDTLVVTVQESATNTDIIVYNKAQDVTLIKGNTPVYFIEEDPDSTYALQFGDGVIGKKPKDGNIIIATYLDSSGTEANNISTFKYTGSATTDFGFSAIVTPTAVEKSYGGSEKETVEEVRFRAPYFYSTQNRAVTKLDYETLVTKDYPTIESVAVWGGEELNPPVYGKIYLSLKTKSNYELTNLEKESIKENLIKTRNILTVIPEIVDPDYEYVLIRGKVTYNPSVTSRSSAELLQLVRAAISDYASNELNQFSSTFRKSKLQSYIESAEKSITGSDLRIYLQKREFVTTNVSANYVVQFNTPLKKGDYINKLYSYPEFRIADLNNTLQTVYIEEVPDSFTGIDRILVVDSGRGYLSPPTVTISGDGNGATATANIVNGRVQSIQVTNKGSTYTRAIVSITGGGGSEATATAVLESRLGTLRTYYFKSTGEKVIVNPNAGDINYDTGEITLRSLLPVTITQNENYATNILTLNAPSENDIIAPLKNRILSIDEDDNLAIQIEMVPEE